MHFRIDLVYSLHIVIGQRLLPLHSTLQLALTRAGLLLLLLLLLLLAHDHIITRGSGLVLRLGRGLRLPGGCEVNL